MPAFLKTSEVPVSVRNEKRRTLAAGFRGISEILEPPQPTDDFVFGSPSRERLRYSTAVCAEVTADNLLEAAAYARKGAQRTHADLVARWQEDQAHEAEERRKRNSLSPCVGGL